MDFKEVISKRQSCRNYLDKAVKHDDLVEILKIAQNMPSACNSQPYRFIVAEGETAQAIAPLLSSEDRPINKWATDVPAFMVACETRAKLKPGVTCDSQHYAQMDMGLMSAGVVLTATSMGLATCIIGYFNEDKIRKLLNIPEEVTIRQIIAFGYAKDENVREKIRKPFDEFVGFNKY
ncbi:MAG: nitroreductase family protein [Oscillospiraceae bacterium]